VSILNRAMSFRSFSLGGGLRFLSKLPPLGLEKYDTIDESSNDFELRSTHVGNPFFRDSSSYDLDLANLGRFFILRAPVHVGLLLNVRLRLGVFPFDDDSVVEIPPFAF